jgi:hypothetical protein
MIEHCWESLPWRRQMQCTSRTDLYLVHKGTQSLPKIQKAPQQPNAAFAFYSRQRQKADVAKPSSSQPLLPSFKSSMACGCAASHKFGWAAHERIPHAQLDLISSDSGKDFRDFINGNFCEHNRQGTHLKRQTLTDKCASSAPIACRLSNFHILVIYPGTVFTLTIKSQES